MSSYLSGHVTLNILTDLLTVLSNATLKSLSYILCLYGFFLQCETIRKKWYDTFLYNMHCCTSYSMKCMIHNYVTKILSVPSKEHYLDCLLCHWAEFEQHVVALFWSRFRCRCHWNCPKMRSSWLTDHAKTYIQIQVGMHRLGLVLHPTGMHGPCIAASMKCSLPISLHSFQGALWCDVR